jgi:hypothetical protein
MFKNSTFSHCLFMYICMWIWGTLISSLYSTNWLSFMTEMQGVQCAVRTEYVYVIKVTLSLLMVKAQW